MEENQQPAPSTSEAAPISRARNTLKGRHDKFRRNDQRMMREVLESKYHEFIVARARAKKPSTQKLYGSAFRRFLEFCKGAGISTLPATVAAVASYLHQEIEAGASPEKIRLIVAAISYAHKIKTERGELPFGDPTDDELVKAIVHSTTVKGRKLDGAASGLPAKQGVVRRRPNRLDRLSPQSWRQPKSAARRPGPVQSKQQRAVHVGGLNALRMHRPEAIKAWHQNVKSE